LFNRQFKLKKRGSEFTFVVAILVVGALLFAASSLGILRTELLTPILGLVVGFFYFYTSQHLHETKLFHELFREFNRRYDELNEGLNRIARDTSVTLTEQDCQTLFDYFNLCAEEYLYFKNGFIEQSVWDSWLNGMRHFAEVEKIRRLWESEARQNSYYGFDLKLLAK
jgi:hypothetical protein